MERATSIIGKTSIVAVVLIVLVLIALALIGPPEDAPAAECQRGASSVYLEVRDDGEVVRTVGPVTTGCA